MASVCTSNTPASAQQQNHRRLSVVPFISRAFLSAWRKQSAKRAETAAYPARAGSSALALAALLAGAAAGCADTKPAVQYGADQLLSMWNDSMRSLADKHAGCPYERDLPFNHRDGACYPLKCKNSGDEVSLLRKNDGFVYKCNAGCDGGCSSVARF